MAILDCQFDYIRNELQSRDGGHACDLDLEARRDWLTHTFNPDFEPGRHAFNLGHTFTRKDNGRQKELRAFFVLALALSTYLFPALELKFTFSGFPYI